MASKRILIVEDNTDSGITLQMILHALGHDAQHVLDGESAMPVAAGIDHHLVKPLDLQALKQAIGDLPESGSDS